jgi:toxin ParE1/3/4
MTPLARILPAAEQDIDHQAEYLFNETGLETALRFYDAVAATFGQLVRMPHVGERRESANPQLAGMRVWRINGFPNHLVFYRPVEGGIQVIRVLHAARDVATMLDLQDAD